MSRPIAALILVAAVLAIAPAARAAETPAVDRAKIEQVIHDYILRHPEVLIEALQAAEAKEKADSEAQARASLVERRQDLQADPTAPVGGNPKGDVTIVEFFDYRCPYCKQIEPTLEGVLREDGRVRVVYKEFPVLGPDSVYASRAALAARKQGKYDAFHGAMLTARGQINEQVVLQLAASVGLDIARLEDDMKSSEIEDLLRRNYELAQKLQIRGTPAFVIGDEMIPGAVSAEFLRRKIAAARKG